MKISNRKVAILLLLILISKLYKIEKRYKLVETTG